MRREDDDKFDDNIAINLDENAFVFCFKEARLWKTAGSDQEHNTFVGKLSTIMRSLTSKNGDLFSQLDNINEDVNEDDNKSTSLKNKLNNNHAAANNGRIKGQLPLEQIFGFC